MTFSSKFNFTYLFVRILGSVCALSFNFYLNIKQSKALIFLIIIITVRQVSRHQDESPTTRSRWRTLQKDIPIQIWRSPLLRNFNRCIWGLPPFSYKWILNWRHLENVKTSHLWSDQQVKELDVTLSYYPTGGSACVQMRRYSSFLIPLIFNWGSG